MNISDLPDEVHTLYPADLQAAGAAPRGYAERRCLMSWASVNRLPVDHILSGKPITVNISRGTIDYWVHGDTETSPAGARLMEANSHGGRRERVPLLVEPAGLLLGGKTCGHMTDRGDILVCSVRVDDSGRHRGPHVDRPHGNAEWENEHPADPTETQHAPPPRPPRRLGVLVIPESDLVRLARVQPGQRITGITTDPMMQAVLLRVEGDGLPEVDDMCVPPRVDALRYQAPPLVERVDVDGMPADQAHAAVQRVLLELIEHAYHLGADTGVVPDLSVNAHAAWTGALEIVRRHAPDLQDRGAYQPSKGQAPGCLRCLVDLDGQLGAESWPCPDYRAAAQGAVFGMEVPSDE